MHASELGQEIRKLRLQAGVTLRGLAARLQVSPAHLSDLEHNRRRPSEKLLRRIAHELRHVGATFETLEELLTGIDPETRDWAASTPGARALFRELLESGRDPREIRRALEKLIGPRGKKKGRKRRKAAVDGGSARRDA